MHTISINTLDDLDNAALKFIDLTAGHRKFAFYGAMGSGKTTFIKAVCKALGATSLVTSPTFSLVNEYPLESGEVIYHFDLYRINNSAELFDLGYEEYFFSDYYVFIEWAERAGPLIPDKAVKVSIQEVKQNKRLITISL